MQKNTYMHDKQPLISFILPAYKGHFLKESIKSILNQTYIHFELVIVNDCSPEDIRSIVLSYNDEHIRYYENEKNIGAKDLVANWNHCLQYAQGEWAVMASDDDVYAPEFASEMIRLVEKYPEVNLVHSRLQVIDAQGRQTAVSEPSIERESAEEFIFQNIVKRRKQVAPNFMFRLSAMKGIGGFVNFPMAWGSDDATWCKLALTCEGVGYSSQALFSWRYSGENISSLRSNLFDKAKTRILFATYFEKEILPFLKKEGEAISAYYGYLSCALIPSTIKQELMNIIINSGSVRLLTKVARDKEVRAFLGKDLIRKMVVRFCYVKL